MSQKASFDYLAECIWVALPIYYPKGACSELGIYGCYATKGRKCLIPAARGFEAAARGSKGAHNGLKIGSNGAQMGL